ncbi:hypothetical protein Tsubulata_045777 [Turnera subulata]|uniref:Disease resistance N-terminal domain-containing protein n=1 Tax=Turnera subulata TaxID=218843 RepID=A0A9Q0F8M4_9ROSI|nr:hypothetical protein Tsubulata_045777 [Turnera subulata]
MAEIILKFALEETLKKVGSLAVEEERQAREASVKIWLQNLREVAYEAEDVLDEFGYEVLRQKVETTPTEKVRNFFSASLRWE